MRYKINPITCYFLSIYCAPIKKTNLDTTIPCVPQEPEGLSLCSSKGKFLKRFLQAKAIVSIVKKPLCPLWLKPLFAQQTPLSLCGKKHSFAKQTYSLN